MSGTTIKFKKLVPNAKIPVRVHPGDLGFDLFTVDPVFIQAGETVAVPTGIAAGLPEGWGACIKARSSQGKLGLDVFGGVVDQGYTGEIIVLIHNSNAPQGEGHVAYNPGDKIAQLILVPVFPGAAEEVDILEGTARGDKGFGSSGR